jgi:hypothetical protein
MEANRFVTRIQFLIDKGCKVLSSKKSYSIVAGEYVDNDAFADFRTSSLAFISQIFGNTSPNYLDFQSRVLHARPPDVEHGIGILRASKEELEGGWLITTKNLISAEIFSSYLEMAKYLLDEKFKDAAAVIIGSTLEQHLRKLAMNNGIELNMTKSDRLIPKNTELVNSELTKANIYNHLDQKNITGLLDLRNKAAHGHYDEYTQSQVEIMYQSVLDFMTRVQ